MNKLIFAGRTAAAPELNTYGDTKVVKFRLIRNEYAGKDDSGQRKEREVSILARRSERSWPNARRSLYPTTFP